MIHPAHVPLGIYLNHDSVLHRLARCQDCRSITFLIATAVFVDTWHLGARRRGGGGAAVCARQNPAPHCISPTHRSGADLSIHCRDTVVAKWLAGCTDHRLYPAFCNSGSNPIDAHHSSRRNDGHPIPSSTAIGALRGAGRHSCVGPIVDYPTYSAAGDHRVGSARSSQSPGCPQLHFGLWGAGFSALYQPRKSRGRCIDCTWPRRLILRGGVTAPHGAAASALLLPDRPQKFPGPQWIWVPGGWRADYFRSSQRGFALGGNAQRAVRRQIQSQPCDPARSSARVQPDPKRWRNDAQILSRTWSRFGVLFDDSWFIDCRDSETFSCILACSNWLSSLVRSATFCCNCSELRSTAFLA